MSSALHPIAWVALLAIRGVLLWIVVPLRPFFAELTHPWVRYAQISTVDRVNHLDFV